MTVYELKRFYAANNPEGFFFCSKTMRFFGDTMKNFGVKDGGKIKTMTDNGVEEVEVWDLYRRRPVNGGMYGHCACFRKDNGQEVFSHV